MNFKSYLPWIMLVLALVGTYYQYQALKEIKGMKAGATGTDAATVIP